MSQQDPLRRAELAAKRQAEQERRAEIMRLKREGKTFEQIGAHYGITRQTAHKLYLKALRSIPAMEIEEYRSEQLERLDDQLRRCYELLDRKHVVVSNGRVVRDEFDVPLDDDDIVLRTLEQIRRIEADRRLLLGLNAAVKAEVSQTVTTYQIDLGDSTGKDALT